MLKDAQTIYDFVTKSIGYREEDIFVVGRSIGSGPATYIASHNRIGVLILISPFTSLRGVVKEIAGNLVQYLVKERFQNIELVKSVQSPVLIIHGQQDKLISCEQSKKLLRTSFKVGVKINNLPPP